jgi:hypothetical protein
VQYETRSSQHGQGISAQLAPPRLRAFLCCRSRFGCLGRDRFGFNPSHHDDDDGAEDDGSGDYGSGDDGKGDAAVEQQASGDLWYCSGRRFADSQPGQLDELARLL